jgi:cysteine-rich repeat protein
VPVAVCGDGQVDAGEECDDGPANDDDGACTMVCVLATCGDGLVHKGVEACDDANGNDIDGCTAACANGPQQLGKYDVSSGPKWQDDPAPVSCKEACAQLHGGGPEEYACSTVEGEINGKAYLNGYEDQTYCASPADDDFKAGENYNCGKAGCAFSARVNDSCWNSYNVCWKL